LTQIAYNIISSYFQLVSHSSYNIIPSSYQTSTWHSN